MRNPEYTRSRILQRSAVLFNTRGYQATSVSDITDATGFTKGAIYRHFKNKEELERQSLATMAEAMYDKLRAVVKPQPTAGKKLRALFGFFESYITDPPFKGGCPLMNAAIESDDAHPVLKREALKILDTLRKSIVTIIENGVKYKQIKPGVDAEFYATLIIASLEGAIMMGRLQGNNNDIRRILKHLTAQLTEIEL
ncbi:MAG TPA: TetR/AcrR family transcriptional regulator [Cyclobacteriaceae bacterium]|jgi:AcrR family transcriptional regulator